jgi:tyrosyl-tRNA synthetase
MALKDIIEKLPPEQQEIAALYLPLLTDMAMDEINQWVELVLAGNRESAYKIIVSKMATGQLLAEQDRINAKLKAISEKDAGNEETQKQLLRDLFTLLIKAIVAAI